KQRLLTNSECTRQGLGYNSSCPICGCEIEDTLHVLRDCSIAKEAWMHVVPIEQQNSGASHWECFSGGVLRDQAGNWILGYNRYLGSCTPFEAELYNKGLEDLGITILRQVQRIMRSKGQCRVRYVPRGKNIIAGYLAKLCLAWKSSLGISDVPPNEVLGALQQDKACGAFEQLI
ncbi:hypothetical protein Golob_021603, partial [Gossypium lobatum]|nr:hypothetical protein [Gossypium lobatum]